MKFVKLVIITVFALFAFACGDTKTVNTLPTPSPAASPTPVVSTTPDAIATAREYYSDNCASCHQDNGEGGPVKIEGKRLNVPALTKGHALGHSDDELKKQISDGGDGMPAFKNKASAEEINNLVRYVRTQFQGGTKAKASDARPDALSAAPTDLKPATPDKKSKD